MKNDEKIKESLSITSAIIKDGKNVASILMEVSLLKD